MTIEEESLLTEWLIENTPTHVDSRVPCGCRAPTAYRMMCFMIGMGEYEAASELEYELRDRGLIK